MSEKEQTKHYNYYYASVHSSSVRVRVRFYQEGSPYKGIPVIMHGFLASGEGELLVQLCWEEGELFVHQRSTKLEAFCLTINNNHISFGGGGGQVFHYHPPFYKRRHLPGIPPSAD